MLKNFKENVNVRNNRNIKKEANWMFSMNILLGGICRSIFADEGVHELPGVVMWAIDPEPQLRGQRPAT